MRLQSRTWPFTTKSKVSGLGALSSAIMTHTCCMPPRAPSLMGHSIGAPVALLVAQRRPDLVRAIVFSQGVFHFDGWKPGLLSPLPADVLEFLGGLYGEGSPHGPEHWASVWSRLDDEHHRAPALTSCRCWSRASEVPHPVERRVGTPASSP
jgi:pimeloyl-ACP methyl ester carboxylesterase